jgi:pyridoxal phosphate enzyme (YggS family)
VSRNDLDDVLGRVASAAQAAGRDSAEITLIAVSKGRTITDIQALHAHGQRDFAENRAAELQTKAEADVLRDSRWHFIGNVQSGQCRRISRYAHQVHSLDRPTTARLLGSAADLHRETLDGFLQVNMTGQDHRNGVRADVWETYPPQLDGVLSAGREIVGSPGIALRGLMTMAPPGLTNTQLHFLFARTRELLGRVRKAEPGIGTDLSMGMSDDFEIAIAEGATHIRLGRILFNT